MSLTGLSETNEEITEALLCGLQSTEQKGGILMMCHMLR